MATSYWEKLKDPRWQKMRLKIMERDEFKCRGCGCGDKTLNVHHIFYRKGADPWDYPLDGLRTLCEDCHALDHDAQDVFKFVVACFLSMGASIKDLDAISAEIHAAYMPGMKVNDDQWQLFAFGIGLLIHHLRDGGDLKALIRTMVRLAPML